MYKERREIILIGSHAFKTGGTCTSIRSAVTVKWHCGTTGTVQTASASAATGQRVAGDGTPTVVGTGCFVARTGEDGSLCRICCKKKEEESTAEE